MFGHHEETASNDAYLGLPIISLPAEDFMNTLQHQYLEIRKLLNKLKIVWLLLLELRMMLK